MQLSEVVSIKRRFQRSIRIDADRNEASALDGFYCPASASEALIAMAHQVSETGQGAFTWTGPFGSGKSSLALALASLLGPAGPMRQRARTAMGVQTADDLLKLLSPRGGAWEVLPVTGRRSNPEAVLGAALDALDQKKSKARHAVRTQRSKDDLIERLIARETGSQGLLIIIDEMGKFLEEAAHGTTDVYFFQRLAEAASRSKKRLLVIGILHQAFDDYASRLARETRDEWLKVQGRFADIPINVAAEEQVELIARAIECNTRPDSNRKLAKCIAESIRRNRPGSGTRLEDRLHECWPLHPIVACLLGPLSRRRFGQNQRTIFGFLNSAEPFGFQDFLRTTHATETTCYDAAHLWEYLRANFEPSILASPDSHRWSLAIDAIERCEFRGSDPMHLRVVKTVAIIEHFRERSGLLPTTDVLSRAIPGLGERRLQAILDDLLKWSILIFKRHLGSYAIYAGSDFDIDAATEQARARMVGIDFVRLRSTAMLHPLLAKRHYHKTGALRWFEVDIAPLSLTVDRAREYVPKNGAAGLFILSITGANQNEKEARRACKDAAAASGDWPIAVGWCRNSSVIRDLAAELLALENVRLERHELQGDAVARREVNARIATTAATIEEKIRQAFASAEWECQAISISPNGGLANLNAVASYLADWCYPAAPRLHNELLNRIRPSSNAIAAQKALLKAMVEQIGARRLGIEGYPAEGGLFQSLIEAPGVYALQGNQVGKFRFVDPPSEDPARLLPLWREAEKLLQKAGPAGITLDLLYQCWRNRPFGVRDGLLPVLAVAFILAKIGRFSIYLDGAFQPHPNSLFVDRLTQEPGSVRLRWNNISKPHLHVLNGVADLVSEFGGFPSGSTNRKPIQIARGLVAIVTGLRPWVLKTTRLSGAAIQVRNLIKVANDPNKFLLDDIPMLFGDGMHSSRFNAAPIVESLGTGLRELVQAYGKMLRELEQLMFKELRISRPDKAAIFDLHVRAETVLGLTGNYRLDAFATRLRSYLGTEEEVEGIASLAANKPPRDWVDRDIDQAGIEIATLAQEFLKAEGLAHVKGRRDKRLALAFFTSDPARPSPIKLDFNVTDGQQGEVERLVIEILGVIERTSADPSVALAALAELGTRFARPEANSSTLVNGPTKNRQSRRLT